MRSAPVKPWFTVEPIGRDTLVFSEYRHWEETHCYLLLGRTSALLIDTGLGVCDLAPLVRAHTGLPVLAAATHVHWDHIGSHGSFAQRGVHPAEAPWLRRFPLPLTQVRQDLTRGFHDFPPEFDPDAFAPFEGAPTCLLNDGDEIDLGGRRIQVLHTPGHSPGHLCFYEPDRGWLFTGDLIYEGTLYAFYPSTDPLAFARSVKRLAALPVTRLFPGHHRLEIPCSLLAHTDHAFDTLADRGMLYQGSGLFDFGPIQIHI